MKIPVLLGLSLFFQSQLGAQLPAPKPAPSTDTIIFRYLANQIYYTQEGERQRWGFYEEKAGQKLMQETIYDTIIYRSFPTQKEIAPFYEVKKKGLWGLLRADRSVWVEAQYTGINFNHKSEPKMINIRKDSLFGILTEDAKPLLEPNYEEILFDGFYFQVRKGKQWGILDRSGKEILPLCFDGIYENRADMDRSLVWQGAKWSTVRWLRQGDKPCDFAVYYDRIDGLMHHFVVEKGGKWGVLNLDGKPVLPMEYEGIAMFGRRFLSSVLVKQKGKLGLYRIDSTDKAVEKIPIAYDDIWMEEATLKIMVRKGKFKDYYYQDGPYFNLQYNDVCYHEAVDVFSVKKGKVWGLMDGKTNKPISKPRFERFVIISGDNFLVKVKGKWGMIGRRGQTKIPIVYKDFELDLEGDKLLMLHPDGTTVPFKIRY